MTVPLICSFTAAAMNPASPVSFTYGYLESGEKEGSPEPRVTRMYGPVAHVMLELAEIVPVAMARAATVKVIFMVSGVILIKKKTQVADNLYELQKVQKKKKERAWMSMRNCLQCRI